MKNSLEVRVSTPKCKVLSGEPYHRSKVSVHAETQLVCRHFGSRKTPDAPYLRTTDVVARMVLNKSARRQAEFVIEDVESSEAKIQGFQQVGLECGLYGEVIDGVRI